MYNIKPLVEVLGQVKKHLNQFKWDTMSNPTSVQGSPSRLSLEYAWDTRRKSEKRWRSVYEKDKKTYLHCTVCSVCLDMTALRQRLKFGITQHTYCVCSGSDVDKK